MNDSSEAKVVETMRVIRLVGRGGQGVVTAGDLLGRAAVLEGRWAQSIPTFGPERRGAPAFSTLRIGSSEILLKCSTARPDVLLVFERSVWQVANVILGLQPGATLVFNSSKSSDEVESSLRSGEHGYKLETDGHAIHTVDATKIALEVLGRPITNTAMMGAFVAVTKSLSMASLETVLQERFSKNADMNIEAARSAHRQLTQNGG